MKQIIAISIAILMSVPLVAQQTEVPKPLTREQYLKKSKGSLIAGTICLIGGITMETIATVSALREAGKEADYELRRIFNPNMPPYEANSKGNVFLFVAGSIAVIASIPMFIGAGVNKRKAKAFAVSVKPETYLQPQPGGLTRRMMPSLALKIAI